MADTASLVVRVTSKGVSSTKKELSGLANSAASAAGAIGLAVSASAGFSKLVSTARQTSVMAASLKTMTGSAENAAIAFSELEKIAAQTPFTLDQSVNAFTKLVSLGLNPSQAAMISYGNTASAMGKDLTQMIEAVADATTGEFERLKEFGIKASAQGDNVAFTFQGITTTVGKNAAEIEGYLQGLGDNQFAGAMADRMNTLDGALSNLQDNWDGLFRAISSQGAGDLITDQVRLASGALAEVNAMLSSGEVSALLSAWGGQWGSTFDDVATMLGDLDKYVSDVLQDWGVDAKDSSDFFSKAFWEFPANMRAAIQVATVEIAGFADKTQVYANMISAYLNPKNLFYEGSISEYYGKQLDVIDANVRDTASTFLVTRTAAIAKLGEEKQAAVELRAEYEKSQKSAPVDLGSFKIGGAGASEPSKEQLKAAAAADKKRQADIESAKDYIEQLRRDNLSELQLIDAQEIDKIDKVASYRESSLISEQEYQDALKEITTTATTDRVDIEIEAAQKISDEKAKIAEAQAKLDEKIAVAKEKSIDDGISAQRQMTADLRSTLGEQSAIYKASAIVSATIDTYKAANGAFAALASIPVIGPGLGAAAAGLAIGAGLANVAAIAGAREQGGSMSAGAAYQMAERGKAEVIVPSGSSRARTASQMRDIMGSDSGGSTSVSLVVIDQSTGGKNFSTEQNDDGRIILLIRDTVSNDLQGGNTQISKSLTSSFKVDKNNG